MVKDSFSTGEAVRITGVSFRNIDYWARTKFIVPSVKEARGTGTERKYSFSDLLALRVARELREAGISTQRLRRVVDFLHKQKGLPNPLAECHLLVTGNDVQVATSPQKIMSVLQMPGQTSFVFVFDLARTVEEMQQEIETRERKPPATYWGEPVQPVAGVPAEVTPVEPETMEPVAAVAVGPVGEEPEAAEHPPQGKPPGRSEPKEAGRKWRIPFVS